VLSYAVSQRLQEIGIRLALGASRWSVFRLVMLQALMLVGIGTGLGLAGSWALTRLIAVQLYRTQATDPVTFAAVAALMIAVGLAATYIPARRALKVDPAMDLRCECMPRRSLFAVVGQAFSPANCSPHQCEARFHIPTRISQYARDIVREDAGYCRLAALLRLRRLCAGRRYDA
jgi:predicted lysophospholipase L1 biosynthesis ABC-type transport system permease subunit